MNGRRMIRQATSYASMITFRDVCLYQVLRLLVCFSIVLPSTTPSLSGLKFYSKLINSTVGGCVLSILHVPSIWIRVTSRDAIQSPDVLQIRQKVHGNVLSLWNFYTSHYSTILKHYLFKFLIDTERDDNQSAKSKPSSKLFPPTL